MADRPVLPDRANNGKGDAMMRAFSVFGMVTVLMQAQTETGGCLQDFGLFPGLFGNATLGVGVGGGLNTAPPVDPNDLFNPPIIPVDGTDPFDPNNPLDPNVPVDPNAAVTLVIDNDGPGDMLVEFLIDGLVEQITCDARERCVTEFPSCVQSIDLQRIVLLNRLFSPNPGTIDLFNLPESDFIRDTALDWPGPNGTLDCGDIIRYRINLLDDPTTDKLLATELEEGTVNTGLP